MALAPPVPSEEKFVGIGYGSPGSGKTTWGTAYPEEWGTAAYIAIDNDAWRLKPVLSQYRSRLEVVEFKGDSPLDNLNQVAVQNWKKEGHGVLIVDTLSRAAKKLLMYSAKVHLFPGDRIMMGPKSAEISQALPIPGDYGGVQHLIMNWVDALFEHQRDMHIILLCHEDLYVPDQNKNPGASSIGGPATIGNALLREFPSEFPVVARLEVVNKTAPDGTSISKYNVITSMRGVYTARIREAEKTGNPMPVVTLARDPRNWWDLWVKHFMSKEVVSAQG